MLVMNQECSGVDLYNVVGIQGQKSAFAHDLEFTGVLYEHVPNAHHLASIAFGKLPCRLGLRSADDRSTLSFNSWQRVLALRQHTAAGA